MRDKQPRQSFINDTLVQPPTLCYRCNREITGDHYVAELKRWTAIAMTVARTLTGGEQGNAVELIVDRAHPRDCSSRLSQCWHRSTRCLWSTTIGRYAITQ